uniref:J domain-containing protein n=1 Tax=Paramormyrops kingsleyae TaxID=1676925 RepID=A0A3B3SWY9_9TELE
MQRVAAPTTRRNSSGSQPVIPQADTRSSPTLRKWPSICLSQVSRGRPLGLVQLLGVTQRQIKTSYYRQMLVYHPDRRGRKSEAKQHSLEIREAYIIRGNRILHRRGFSSPATDRQKSSPSSRMPRTSSKDGKLRRIFKIVCTLYCNFTKWDIVQRAKIFLQGSETICDAVLRGYGRFVWLTSQTLGRVILSGV